MHFVVSACVAFAVGTSVAHAEMPTVLGLTLGQSLPLWPTCTSDIKPCIRDEADNIIDLSLDQNSLPQLIGDSVKASVNNGRIVALEMHTFGYNYQAEVLNELSEKFGNPTNKTLVPIQNGYGASLDIIRASWDAKDYKVLFIGGGYYNHINFGLIQILTAEEANKLETAKKASQNSF